MAALNFITILILYLTNLKYIHTKMARCYMIPDNNSTASGEVKFTQIDESSPVTIEIKVFGVNAIHGFHMHEKGSIEGGCMAAGAHFNPFNLTHGGANTIIRHMGDLGNVKTNQGDAIIDTFTNDKVSLFGDNTIVGRTCVIHALEDDLGIGKNSESKKTGNSGMRIACGVLNEYDPLMSLMLGMSFLVLGLGVSLYYFLCLHKKKNIEEEIHIMAIK